MKKIDITTPHSAQSDLDGAIKDTPGAKEIYIHKDTFKAVRSSGNPGSADAAPNMPIVEKKYGSTKQIGNYRDLPVYSHGRGKDEVDVSSG